VELVTEAHACAIACTAAASLLPQSDLSDPIDVYSEWIDSCESINKKVAEHRDMGEQDPYEEQLGAGDESD
jgi:transcription elongation factor Elf1